MKKNQHSAKVSAEMKRIEKLIAEHGPSTAHFLRMKMRMTMPVINGRLAAMRAIDMVHVSYRETDPLTNSNTRSAHYALGADPGVASDCNPKRGHMPYRPVFKTWPSVKANSDPLHAAFFGRMA